MQVNWKQLLISIGISLGTGALAGFLTQNSMEVYSQLKQPALSPPGWIFPVVWTILYILMGISAYLIYESNSPKKEKALTIYVWQLFFNFLWSIIFFNLQNILLAFIVLIILWILIVAMIKAFKEINPLAAWLQIPYLLWVTFAGYLNLMLYILNQ